jgi:hypothetical protein
MIARIMSLGVCLCFLINVPCQAAETISSSFLTVSVDSQAGTWRCSSKEGAALLRRVVGAVFTGSRVLRTSDQNSVRTTSVTSFQDKLGSGKQVTLHLVDHQSGIQWQLDIGVYDQFAGLRLDWQLRNSTAGKLDLRSATVADVEIETKPEESTFAAPPYVRVLCNGFNSWDYSHVVRLKSSEMVRSSESIALDAPNLICGFLSATTAYGTFEYALDSDDSTGLLRSTAEFNVILEPGQTRPNLKGLVYSLASDGLYVNLFEPSTIQWTEEGASLRLKMVTRFPFDPEVRLQFSAARPTQAKIRVRVPSWAAREMAVYVNGKPATGQPGSYVVLDRAWAEGDIANFTLPAALSAERYTGVDQIPDHERYAVSFRPILLAAVGAPEIRLRLEKVRQPEDLLKHLKPKPGQLLHYLVENNPGVEFMPYWQVDKEPFNCFPAVHTRA